MEEPTGLELVSRFLQGDDDVDSLFGGDDWDGELGSLFTEPAAGVEAPPHGADCEPELPLSQERPHEATNPPAQLDSAADHTQTRSAQHPTLSLPQLSPPVLPQLSLPAVPDPLVASLSHQHGHTSGDLVVSTQVSASGPGPAASSPEDVPDDAALEAELTGLWEAGASDEQPINAQAESQENDAIHEETEILTTQIPGFRYANSTTNSHVRLPRRIDNDDKFAEDLVYYITLNRQTRVEVLCDYLELDVADGKRLMKDMKELLKEPPLAALIAQPASRSTETKKILVRIAFYMLISKEWGRTWFGEDHETAASRKSLWPRDSSVILAGFVMVLYRVYTNQKQKHQSIVRAKSRLQEANPSPPPTPASVTRPTDSPFAQFADTPSAQLADSLSADQPVDFSSAQPANSSQSPLPAPVSQSFFEAIAKDASAGKKRKHGETVLGINQLHYDVEVPANARLKYHIYVKDKEDGDDLACSTYRHTDYMISRGAFSSLKAAFETVGQDPAYVIRTPFDNRTITSEEEWDNAVLVIYNARRSGGVVEVDIYI